MGEKRWMIGRRPWVWLERTGQPTTSNNVQRYTTKNSCHTRLVSGHWGLRLEHLDGADVYHLPHGIKAAEADGRGENRLGEDVHHSVPDSLSVYSFLVHPLVVNERVNGVASNGLPKPKIFPRLHCVDNDAAGENNCDGHVALNGHIMDLPKWRPKCLANSIPKRRCCINVCLWNAA